ncbi:hypothetical protein pb186bvf_010022 [Paramecium bursaria]
MFQEQLVQNGLHTFTFQSMKGMQLIQALSLADHLTIKTDLQSLIEIGCKIFQEAIPPLLLRYFNNVEDVNENMNNKQLIALYAQSNNVRVKEYYFQGKSLLFCNIFSPNGYNKTIYILQYTNQYLPMLNDKRCQKLQKSDQSIAEMIKQRDNENLLEFDVIPENGFSTNSESKTVRRHKKSFSDHQLIDNQRQQKNLENEQSQQQFSIKHQEQYQFPPTPTDDYQLDKKYTGKLKFFDDQKNYGFIIMDTDKSDIFVHLDDLQKAGLSKEYLKQAKHGSQLRFQFECMKYVGKYKESRKAVDLKIIGGVK